MYGWLCGIIFSKLALSTSLVAAKKARTIVRMAQTASTARRLLNTRRSRALPDLGLNSARSRMTGIVVGSSWEAAAMALLSERGSAGFGGGDDDTARADERELSAARVGDSSDHHRRGELQRLPGAAAVGRAAQPPAHVGQH